MSELSEKKEHAAKERISKGEPAPESLVTWIFQDDFIPRAKLTKDGCYSIFTDYLGTPVGAYDETGNLVWERELDINGKVMPAGKDNYGRTLQDVGEKNFIPFRFQGQYEDEETGLYYNRFRYYDPETGQYTQQDPIGLAGGNPTLYGYVYNTLGEIDPFGLSTRPNNGLYHVFDVFSLDENLWLSSDAVQFNRANKAFIQRMNIDQVFRRDMLRRYPALLDWLDNPKLSKSPAGLTWHHSPDVSGQLQLVDRLDHKNNHGLYHPDGQGGREKWGGGKGCR